jgi:hypothetical protein
MLDAPATTRSQRYRGRQWVADAIGRLIHRPVAFWFSRDPTVKKAAVLQLGVNKDEVFFLMQSVCLLHSFGWEHEQRYGDRRWKLQSVTDRILNLTYCRIPLPDWPVVVHFDREHRADRIKRGSEITETKTTP